MTGLTGAQAALGAISFLVLAARFTPSDFGTFSLGVAAGSFVPLLVGLGSEHILLMYGSKRQEELPELMSASLAVWGGLGVLALGFSWGISAFLPWTGETRVAVGALLTSGLVSGITTPLLTSYMRVLGRTAIPWSILVVGRAGFLGFLLLAPTRWSGLAPTTLGYLGSHVLSLVLMVGYAAPMLALRWRPATLYRRWAVSVRFWVAQLADLAFIRQDLFLVGLLLGTAEAGVYAVGVRVVTLAMLLPSAFHVVMMPDFHRAAEMDGRQLRGAWQSATSVLGGLGVLVMAYLVLHGSQIRAAFFPDHYSGAGVVISVLGLYASLNMVAYPMAMVLDARAEVGRRLRARVFALATMVPLIAVGASALGVAGAAAGAMLGMGTYTVLLSRAAWPELQDVGVWVWRLLRRPLFVCFSVSAILAAATRGHDGIGVFLLAAFVYVVAAVAFGFSGTLGRRLRAFSAS